ncbi:MAG: hypothetical protein A3C47_00075 [Omnitrophica bacterium RIFCSPHIGHO2_02_FULL_51_18]|nr:MAG: hypothetical protein A3C47_00075 [Omnitrophica bacterium RIFCSPHIGHO2_02_FULL_51_18]
MVRTIVTLGESDKRWLDRYSDRHDRSTAETIRMAIKEFQKKTQEGDYRRVLKDTAGLLKGVDDSVRSVQKLRQEWD